MKINKNPRIDIPSSPSDAIDLAGSIKTQHDELGKDSPLVVLDWATHGPVIKEATEVNKQIKELTRQVEQSSTTSGESLPSSSCWVLMEPTRSMASLGLDGISIRGFLFTFMFSLNFLFLPGSFPVQ